MRKHMAGKDDTKNIMRKHIGGKDDTKNIMRKHIAGKDVSKIKKKHLSYPFAINNEQ
jgi:hypothetical protein